MISPSIRIARAGLPLGSWQIGEVRILLASGFLLPTDQYRLDDQSDWKSLASLPAEDASSASAVIGLVGQTLRSAMTTVEQTAKAAYKAASGVADEPRQQASKATQRLLHDFLPRLREPVRRAINSTSQTVESVLHDEVLLRKTFGAVYDILPNPVHRFIDERTFVEFCIKNRAKLMRDP